MPANRKNPGVHHAARQSRDREGAGAVADARPSTFKSRTLPFWQHGEHTATGGAAAPVPCRAARAER